MYPAHDDHGTVTTARDRAIVPETLEEFAAAAGVLARWAEDRLAGGAPPKWVALQAAAGARFLASAARNAELEGWWLS